MENPVPDQFIAAPRDMLGRNAWLGPADGRVTTTWTQDEGVMVHIEEAEDLSIAEAEELLAQLSNVLSELSDRT